MLMAPTGGEGFILGRRVDQWTLAALGAAALYLLFLNAWDSVPLACAAAFACCALAGRLLRGIRLPRRATRAQATARLMRLASLSDAEAQAALSELVQGRWPSERFQLTPVLKHPEASLTSGDILNAWKANRGAENLVVAATCPCEPRAALYAAQLREPRVAVVDSRALVRLLRGTPGTEDSPPPAASPWRRLRLLASRCVSTRVTPKNALLAAVLLVMYLRRGQPLYLFCALALLYHFGAAALGHRMGKRLFD